MKFIKTQKRFPIVYNPKDDECYYRSACKDGVVYYELEPGRHEYIPYGPVSCAYVNTEHITSYEECTYFCTDGTTAVYCEVTTESGGIFYLEGFWDDKEVLDDEIL